ncbi:MAG: hypothetical protein KAW09_03235 [Thermoplasmata archaeon]|nr:hypothetical protein [Thermoplasmata archaeon]
MNENKIFSRAFVCVVLWMLVGSALPLISDSSRADSLDWMREGNYFIYNLEQNFTQPESENVTLVANVTIENCTASSITLYELWYESGNQSAYAEGGGVYNRTTRESEDQPGYYSWLWINAVDLLNGTIYLADRVTHLKETTHTHYVLNHSDIPIGNESTLYYSRDTLRLTSTVDHLFGANSTELNSTTAASSSGRGGGRSSRHNEGEN